MFKELNDGELAPFTVVKREAEGEGGESGRDWTVQAFQGGRPKCVPRA